MPTSLPADVETSLSGLPFKPYPETCKGTLGLIVPIPILPVAEILPVTKILPCVFIAPVAAM